MMGNYMGIPPEEFSMQQAEAEEAERTVPHFHADGTSSSIEQGLINAGIARPAAQNGTPRAFEYLLNAMENASHHSNPADHFYGDKRKAVLAYVANLERELAAVVAPAQGVGMPDDKLRVIRDALKSSLVLWEADARLWPTADQVLKPLIADLEDHCLALAKGRER